MEVLYERCCGIDVHKSSIALVFCSSEGTSPRSIFVASVAQRETCVSSLSGSGALRFDMSLWSPQAFIGSPSTKF